MKLSDETLMRYVDGELALEERAAVEAALAADPGSAARVAALRAQREKLARAFGKVLQEPVPERLIAAARTAPAAAAGVTAIEEARVRKAERARARWSLREWSAVAASLIVGFLVAQLALRSDDASLVATGDGGLVAQGDLAQALSERLSGEPAAESMAVGLSYRARNGELCRAFSLSREAPVAGIACRTGETWRIEALAQGEPAADGGYRLAGSALPPLIVQAVEAQIEGDPLDASAEASARSRGWRN
jgi:anti-sigma factor RsiW